MKVFSFCDVYGVENEGLTNFPDNIGSGELMAMKSPITFINFAT